MKNAKFKIISLVIGGLAIVGGVVFAFRDEFLSNKQLYLNIEKENIKLISDKIEKIKEEDMLGIFFDEGVNKSFSSSDISFNISANGLADKIAGFFNSFKLSIKNEKIEKEDYKNREIKLSYNNDELLSGNIVNDGDTLGLNVPKLYDKWIVSDMSLAKFVSEIIKSDEATGTTNTMTLSEVKSVFELSKTEKKDFNNNLNYYLEKLKKALQNVEFTEALDSTFIYDTDKVVDCDSMSLELSEAEALARASQFLDKVKESGQLLDFIYDKADQIKISYGEKNVITDKLPEKKEMLEKINDLIVKIDTRLIELNISDVSLLFDEEDNYIGAEGLNDNKYVMTIYYDRDYNILKREIGVKSREEDSVLESKFEIIAVESNDEKYYMFKQPEKIIIDKVEVNGNSETHNIMKSYYKDAISFEGFKFNKTKKWIDAEKIITIMIENNDNQKTFLVQIPGIKSFNLFADITRIKQSKNELNVIAQIGLDIKGERQYFTIDNTILKKASIEKIDINSNSININESTQEKLNLIVDVAKGNTRELNKFINEKTGLDFSKVFSTVDQYKTKAVETYKALNSLGIINIGG